MSKTETTVVIWSNYQDDPKFYAVPGDLRELNGLYINVGSLDDWQPLLDVTYGHEGDEPFKWKHCEVPISSLKSVIEKADYVIHCGETY